MAKRSPQTFLKRQREMDKKRKAAEKRQRRQERKDGPGGSFEEMDASSMFQAIDSQDSATEAPAVGTVFERYWQGKTITAKITDKGIRYGELTYANMDVCARAIVGKEVDGLRFFTEPDYVPR